MKPSDIFYELDQVWKDRPEAPMLYEDRTVWTYPQFLERVKAWEEKIPSETRRAGVVLDHGVDQIACIFALLKKNAAYVPAEPFLPENRIRFMMEDAQAQIVFYPDHTEVLESCPDEEELAYVLYTSGSTGRPKGVGIRPENLLHYKQAFQAEFQVRPTDMMLQYSVCSFDIFVEEVFASLLNGAALAIPSIQVRDSLPALCAYIEEMGITMLSGFPYLVQKLNELDEIPGSLRLLISGGDVLRDSHIRNLKKRTDAMIYNTYGPSETTVCASYQRCDTCDPLEDGTYPIGHPVAGAEILLLDEDGQEVSFGEIGEICIVGNGVGAGYVGDRKEENKAFYIDKKNRRVYRSGDMGRQLADGSLVFLHRKDEQIMVEGRRVERAETENILCQTEGVLNGHVATWQDQNHLFHLTAYVVLEPGTTVEQVRTSMAEYLTDYMIPEYFICLLDLPINTHGKVDRLRLPAPSFQIVQASLEDLDTLMNWRMETLEHVFGPMPQEEYDQLWHNNRLYYEKALMDGTQIPIFLMNEGQIIGCAGLCLQQEMPSPDNRNGKCAYIMNVYVRDAWRRHGGAHMLTSWLVLKALQENCGKIYLEASEEGKPVYENLGFHAMENYLKWEEF